MANDERLDVIDEHGNPTGETLTYDQVHEQGLWYAVALVWVVNDQSELLIQRRSDHVRFDPSKWDCRFGGHISAHTSSLDGAIRELQEEIGIHAQPGELDHLFRGRYESAGGHATQIKRHVTENYLYRWPDESPALQLDPAEVSETKWVAIDELETWIAQKPADFVLHVDEEPRAFAMIRERLGIK